MTRADTYAAAHLDAATARRLTARIRDSLAHADGLLVEAYTGRAWLALGHATWAEYVAEELPQLQLIDVRGEARDARIRELAAAGLTMGAVAGALAIGKGTVHRALAGVQLEATTTSTDGRTMARRQAPVVRKRRGPRKTDRVVELIRGAGPQGMDVRDVQHALRCQRNEASATLTRLHDAGRLEYQAPERRGLFGRYVATAVAQ